MKSLPSRDPLEDQENQEWLMVAAATALGHWAAELMVRWTSGELTTEEVRKALNEQSRP